MSKSTCSEWEKELNKEVSHLRQENLEALYTSYGMLKEARIKKLGDTLTRIDAALEAVDISQISPEKLLDFKLKYTAALRAEYSAPSFTGLTGDPESSLETMIDVYKRASTGEISTDQAKTELNIIDHVIRGYQRNNPVLDFSL